MKKIIAYLVVLLVFVVNNKTIYSHDLRTPRGSPVEHEHPTDTGWYGYQDGVYAYYTQQQWTTWSDSYYSGLYIERLQRATQAYNCHAYAWANSEQSNPDSYCWIGNDPSCQDENVYWTDGSYDEVTQIIATQVSYGDYKDHSLKVFSGNIMTSKWGRLP